MRDIGLFKIAPKVNLSNKELLYVNLRGANLRGANLTDVKNLTPEQVKQAKNWKTATYDEN
ncbi:MAG: pentapeptide repeat-containing protein [Richelia sp.]|nr:pentapeptide repeat-containing protein [Richelia sp.]CDN14474.1 hypothetical protein RintRC_4514 [Richelia intracellularis]